MVIDYQDLIIKLRSKKKPLSPKEDRILKKLQEWLVRSFQTSN